MKLKKTFLIVTGSVVIGYFILAFVFRTFLYDAPPNIPKVELAVFDANIQYITNENKIALNDNLRGIKGVSGATADPTDNRLTIMYKVKETSLPQLKTDIENKIGTTLTEVHIPRPTGKGCPYHGFLDKVAPIFCWF